MLWWNYGDETINSWKLTLTEEGFHITTLDGAQALAPVNGSTVALTEADITDPEQLGRSPRPERDYFRISPLENPDMVLAPQNSGTSAGTRVMLVTGNEEDQTQLWSLEDADGSHALSTKPRTGYWHRK